MLTAGDGEAAGLSSDSGCVFNVTNFAGAIKISPSSFEPSLAPSKGHHAPLTCKPRHGVGSTRCPRKRGKWVVYSEEFTATYDRERAKQRLDRLRSLALPRLDAASLACGYAANATDVAWHLRAGDLCDSNRTMLTSHFDRAYDAIVRLATANPATAEAAASGDAQLRMHLPPRHHIYTEVSETPTRGSKQLQCLGPRLRLERCLSRRESRRGAGRGGGGDGICTAFRASIDNGTVSVRLLVNGEPFGTVACMASADRLMVPVPSSFSNLAIALTTAPVSFSDVWWRRCMRNTRSKGGLLYARLTRCVVMRLLVWVEPERYAQTNATRFWWRLAGVPTGKKSGKAQAGPSAKFDGSTAKCKRSFSDWIASYRGGVQAHRAGCDSRVAADEKLVQLMTTLAKHPKIVTAIRDEGVPRSRASQRQKLNLMVAEAKIAT